MGAISASSSIPILQEYLSDPERTVRETCEIAIAKIEWDHSEEAQQHRKGLNQSNVPYEIIVAVMYIQDVDLTIDYIIPSILHLHLQASCLGHPNHLTCRKTVFWIYVPNC
jgi:hypothetical protein